MQQQLQFLLLLLLLRWLPLYNLMGCRSRARRRLRLRFLLNFTQRRLPLLCPHAWDTSMYLCNWHIQMQIHLHWLHPSLNVCQRQKHTHTVLINVEIYFAGHKLQIRMRIYDTHKHTHSEMLTCSSWPSNYSEFAKGLQIIWYCISDKSMKSVCKYAIA